MRIVLQHTGSGLYVKEPGQWTGDLKEATNFGSSQRAIKFIRQQRLTQVQVLVACVEANVIDKVALQLPSSADLPRMESLG